MNILQFDEYYNLRKLGQVSREIKTAQQVLLEQAKRGKNQVAIRKAAEEYETLMNAVFYPQGDKVEYKGVSSDQIFSGISEQLEKLWGITLDENFSLSDDGKNTSKMETSFKAIREKYESFSHKNYINYQTLLTRYNSVKSAFDNLGNIVQMQPAQATEENKKLLADLTILERELSQFIKSINPELIDEKGRITFKENDDISIKIASLDNQFKNVSQSTFLTNEQIGDILEYAGGYIGYLMSYLGTQTGEQLVKTAFDKVSKEIVKGKSRAGTSSIINNQELINMTVDYDLTDFITKDKNGKKAHLKIPSTSGGQLELDIDAKPNPNSARQGKADIIFTVPDDKGGTELRISAKNWSDIKGQDFGDTNLIYAIMRQLQMMEVQLYLYTLGDETASDQDIAEVHILAQLASLVDIVLGAMQAESYSNVLMVNERSLKHIFVIPLLDVLDFIGELTTRLSVGSYEKVKNEIYRQLCLLHNVAEQKRPGSSELFLSLSIRFLQTIKVTITSKEFFGIVNQMQGGNYFTV